VYDDLDPTLRRYVDDLVGHAATALWPERRAALASFWQGIAKCARGDQEAALKSLGIEPPAGIDPAEIVFRVVLTAYLERLGEDDITNADQADLYRLSLDESHATLAAQWDAAHPETRTTPA